MSLWLPSWAIDRQCRQSGGPSPDEALVLAAAAGNRRSVTAASATAQALGIAPGMALTDARALHPALIVASADPAGDAAALARLAAACGRYSPWTAAHGADGVWLDVTGCAHLKGGEASLVAELIDWLAGQGIAGRAAIADTPGAAWAMARGGAKPAAVVPSGGVRAALVALPIMGLRLDPTVIAELTRLGLYRIGDLYRLPRSALAPRVGAAAMQRLDQALGAVPEPLSPVPPPPQRWARRRFAEPIATPEALAAAMGALLQPLCRRLANERLGARRLVLTLYRIDGGNAAIAIGTARPSRDPRHLLRLLAERLAEIDPGLGIEDMVLAATRVEPLAAVQAKFGKLLQASPRRPPPIPAGGNILPFPESRQVVRQAARGLLAAEGREHDGTDPAELAALIDRLANRLGSAALYRLQPQESHIPERAARPASVLAPLTGGWDPERRRPIRLLPRPEPIVAMALVPDDPPLVFHWRRVEHRVCRADGPERICGEWWRGEQEAQELRDYYRVEDEAGRRFWLYRAGLYQSEAAPPRWFLHGIFA
jgi:protein ImuB